MKKINVSVVCITYNHEKFIKQALDGFIAQKTNFNYEILISDDNSSDKTSQIIKSYQKKYPDIIKYFPREKNIGIKNNLLDLWLKAQGKYIALCEGDDFWICEDKLQTQFDYMQSNLDCGICFHPALVIDNNENILEVFPKNISTDKLSFDSLLNGNFISTNSVFYRKLELRNNKQLQTQEVMPLDWYMHLIHAKDQTIGFIPRIMSTYRKHHQGVWSVYLRPEDLHRRWGNEEINFFRQLKRLANRTQSKRMQENMDSIFNFMFFDLYSKGKNDELKRLLSLNPDINNGILKNSKDLITITTIVIAFNHEEYIEQCLRSVTMQKGAIFHQIIIIDDFSSDQTPKIINNFIQENKRINIKFDFIRRDKNEGLQANIKLGIEKSCGNFIAFCEGDDYWLSALKLVKQSAYLMTNPEMDMCFNSIILENNLTGEFSLHKDQQSIGTSIVTFQQLLDVDYTANFSCCFYRSSRLKKISEKYFIYNKSANWLLNLILCSEKEIGFINEPLSVYRIHENGSWSSLSQAEKSNEIQNTLKELIRIKPILKKLIKITENKQRAIQNNMDLKGKFITAYCRDFDINIDSVSTEYNSIEMVGWISEKYSLSPACKLNLLFVDDKSFIVQQSICYEGYRPDVAKHLQNIYGKSMNDFNNYGFKASLILNLERSIKGHLVLAALVNNVTKYIDTSFEIEITNKSIALITRRVFPNYG